MLLTSMLDPKLFPKKEVVSLYHERWEIEPGYDEVKTDLLERQEAIRSKTPRGVAQELWAIGLAYNVVRLEMERVAAEAKLPPTRISFIMALRLIRDEWMWISGTNSLVPSRVISVDYVRTPRASSFPSADRELSYVR